MASGREISAARIVPSTRKGTPGLVVERLSVAVHRVLRMPDVVDKLAKLGFEPFGNAPAEPDKSRRSSASGTSRSSRPESGCHSPVTAPLVCELSKCAVISAPRAKLSPFPASSPGLGLG
jgi:hypothetical protein